ncbi:Putative uncharacterized protein [Moritella viscosa]|uniref:Uncharacterized protein n=1 Tax=Moritella viscosa TaxID=80854 RepID=A0ABY1HJ65_9GAMM|nr:Putative uncharacterized protein [Moritella viscosa]
MTLIDHGNGIQKSHCEKWLKSGYSVIPLIAYHTHGGNLPVFFHLITPADVNPIRLQNSF